MNGLLRVCAVLTAASVFAIGSAQMSLSEYLSKRGWDAAKSGAMVVVAPDSVRSNSPARSLSDFNRTLMHAGSLSVVAPTEMVLVDDSFSEPPNFHDGLERYAKIVYLMSLLDDQQWSTITSDGLCADDLRGEAKAVLQSIVPRPFVWTASKLGQDGRPGVQVDSGTVPDTQLSRVRLKIQRGIRLMVSLQSDRNTYLTDDSSMREGEPGQTVYKLDNRDGADRKNPFGIRALRVVTNKPKPTQLEYDAQALDPVINLVDSESIDEALKQVQTATGIELHADLRVGHLQVGSWGKACRAGDLLQGLALAVTGTFRRVGPAYVLTSDLEGIGSRKVKFGIWETLANQEMYRRIADWKLAIGKTGHLSQIRFPQDSPYEPNEAMQTLLDKAEKSMRMEMAPTSTMTPAVRGLLEFANQMYKRQQVDTSKASISTSLQYSFVLPDGNALCAMQGLGSPGEYYERTPGFIPQIQAEPKPPFSLSGLGGTNSSRPAMIQAGDAQSAAWGVDQLHKFGFREIWMEATQIEAMKAAAERAKKLGIKLRLLVRPWALPEDLRSDDEDQTILGDRGDQLVQRELSFEAWPKWLYQGQISMSTPYRSLSPASTSTYSRWSTIGQLARVPGVSGVVIEDFQPNGYEGRRVEYEHSPFEKPFGELSDFGYSVNQRLAFLRAHSLDPIDTIGERFGIRTDIRQPFFPDNATNWADGMDDPSPEMTALVAAWDSVRAGSFEKAANALLQTLPSDLPDGILASPLRAGINDHGYSFQGLFVPVEPPISVQLGMRTLANDGITAVVYRFRPDGKDDTTTYPFRTLSGLLTSKQTVCLDFRGLSLLNLPALLDQKFTRVIDITIQTIDH